MSTKLKCIRDIVYHWGVQLVIGNYYTIERFENRERTIITDYDKYFEINSQVAGTIHDLRKDNADTKSIGESNRKLISFQKQNYTKRVSVPYIIINSESGSKLSFIGLTRQEMFELGCDKDRFGNPSVDVSYYLIDDFFETVSFRRGLRLNELGI